MTEMREIYKCLICGNIVEILHTGKGRLVCCDEPMRLMKENTEDASEEKHVPVIEIKGELVSVKIGSNPHPMEEKHYIEWVDVTDGINSCQILNPRARRRVFKGLAKDRLVKAGNIATCTVCGVPQKWCNSTVPGFYGSTILIFWRVNMPQELKPDVRDPIKRPENEMTATENVLAKEERNMIRLENRTGFYGISILSGEIYEYQPFGI